VTHIKSPGVDSVGVVEDAKRSGNHVLQAKAASTTLARAELVAPFTPMMSSLTFSVRIRAVSSVATFDSLSYVSVANVYCGTAQARAVGVLFDHRGLTLQLDNNNGEYQGFAKDSEWHTVEVSRSPTESRVTIDGAFQGTNKPYTADGTCYVSVGIEGGPSNTPSVDVQIDDIHLR